MYGEVGVSYRKGTHLLPLCRSSGLAVEMSPKADHLTASIKWSSQNQTEAAIPVRETWRIATPSFPS